MTKEREEPLFAVRDLTVRLAAPHGTVHAVDRVSWEVAAGQVVALVGESGSGKTVSTLAPLRLLPPGVPHEITGSVRLRGRELLGLPEPELYEIRGGRIAVVFQDPLSALNPLRQVGAQIAESARNHLRLGARAARERAVELLDFVGIPDPRERARQYAHQLSGGMRQRATIAMALAGEPELLIADEPTTALDVTIQAQVIELLLRLREELDMAMVLITHDIGVVAGAADAVNIMYAGRVAETGTCRDVLKDPDHPYTRGLLSCVPTLDTPPRSRFSSIEGAPPDLLAPVAGCPFAARCPHVAPTCRTAPCDLERVGGAGHRSGCWRHPSRGEPAGATP